MTDSPRVLIINSNEDVVEMLRLKFQQSGWEAATAHVTDAKRGRVDLVALVAQYDPAVIVYDVAPPYEENWGFLQTLLTRETVRSRAFVLTTTNRAQLEKITGEARSAVEIVGKPYDLVEVVHRATNALERVGAPRL